MLWGVHWCPDFVSGILHLINRENSASEFRVLLNLFTFSLRRFLIYELI